MRGMKSYISYEEAGEIFIDDLTGLDLDQVLFRAAKQYAFSDCSDAEVLEVVHNGKRYTYDGWEPGMTFTFRNKAGEIVWSHSFPSWDH